MGLGCKPITEKVLHLLYENTTLLVCVDFSMDATTRGALFPVLGVPLAPNFSHLFVESITLLLETVLLSLALALGSTFFLSLALALGSTFFLSLALGLGSSSLGSIIMAGILGTCCNTIEKHILGLVQALCQLCRILSLIFIRVGLFNT